MENLRARASRLLPHQKGVVEADPRVNLSRMPARTRAQRKRAREEEQAEEEEEERCRLCLDGEEDGPLLQLCACRGSACRKPRLMPRLLVLLSFCAQLIYITTQSGEGATGTGETSGAAAVGVLGAGVRAELGAVLAQGEVRVPLVGRADDVRVRQEALARRRVDAVLRYARLWGH